ncbi:hypothetical protein [Pseudomonas chlororaphis]|uniref:Uncharacterized protein n=1 Tax=Pseudomonas chlororaphis TaxID=587753 RepID=A0A0D5XVD5_9PSED|nr:hypothetical protein [Pseudomonas chlororaphis]AKA22677.1 hypothetical protein PCL1606_12220 [Pseudomonas chlororaphis]MCB2252981.1 hypothetical protein [Pseudomonas chlororaphis]
MTSPDQSPVPDAPGAEQAADASAPDNGKPAIAPFKFPFKPSEFAQAKNNQLPWYKNGVADGHAKTPGAAPPGTRRSMGKR